MISRCTALAVGALSSLALAYSHVDVPADGIDLESYISRPDIRNPKFNITVFDEKRVAPGYWFVAPYVDVHPRIPSTVYQTGQVGPHIYDERGNLVWSGAHLFGDRSTYDFRVATINGSQHLTFIANDDTHAKNFSAGAGVILDSAYNVVQGVANKRGRGSMNMHEFNVIEDGKKALMITYNPQFFDLSTTAGEETNAWVGNNGFQEIDLVTGKTTFEWWPLDHLHPLESTVKRPKSPTNHGFPTDFFHMNSVDKHPVTGDYLISARHMSTIYLISHKDGSIIWRLGGSKSSFELNGFNFSSQHDARFFLPHETSASSNTKKTQITFLNNAADDTTATSDRSAALHVELDTATWTATLIKQYPRPDGQLSHLRGNVQTLPAAAPAAEASSTKGNTFICWSENAYISEYAPSANSDDPHSDLVLEASFSSHRFFSYRAYKFDFTAARRPSEAPALVGRAYGSQRAKATTALWVSWNGATEVAEWRFFASNNKQGKKGFREIGRRAKSGFETRVMTDGFWGRVYAEAVDARGVSLGASDVVAVEAPGEWSLDLPPSSSSPPSSESVTTGRVQDEVDFPESDNGLHPTVSWEKGKTQGMHDDNEPSDLRHRKTGYAAAAVASLRAWKDKIPALGFLAGASVLCVVVALLAVLVARCCCCARGKRRSWMRENYMAVYDRV